MLLVYFLVFVVASVLALTAILGAETEKNRWVSLLGVLPILFFWLLVYGILQPHHEYAAAVDFLSLGTFVILSFVVTSMVVINTKIVFLVCWLLPFVWFILYPEQRVFSVNFLFFSSFFITSMLAITAIINSDVLIGVLSVFSFLLFGYMTLVYLSPDIWTEWYYPHRRYFNTTVMLFLWFPAWVAFLFVYALVTVARVKSVEAWSIGFILVFPVSGWLTFILFRRIWWLTAIQS